MAPTSATEITLGKPDVDYVVGQNPAGNGSVSFRKNWDRAYYLTYRDGRFNFGTSETAGELHLFRVSPATLELYQAFQYVKRYARTDGQYPAEVYKVTLPAGIAAEDAVVIVKDAAGNELETLQVAGNATDDRGRYLVNFYGSTARDMRRVVYATVYANGEAITGTYAYSISSYAWGVQANASAMDAKLVAVTRKMMLYGDRVKAYFG